MRICCATWTIEGAEPGYLNARDIYNWLQKAPKRDTGRNPNKQYIPDVPVDIYAVGIQEIIPMDKSVRIPVPKIIFRQNSIKGANNLDLTRITIRDKVIWAWSTLLVNSINGFEKRASYSLYGSYMLNGVGMFVIVRNEMITNGYIRNGRADTVRADEEPSDLEVMLLPDNLASGAVGIRFDCGASSMAFICSQLRGGDGVGACAERNRQYMKIAGEMFRDVGMKLFSHEYLFWMGDLNYRICPPSLGARTPKEVWDFTKRNQLESLLHADELSAQRRNGLAFSQFREGLPNFNPNYPYQSWMDSGNKRPTSRRRTGNGLKPDRSLLPAWTERILWRRNTGGATQPADFHGGLAAYAMAPDVAKISKHLYMQLENVLVFLERSVEGPTAFCVSWFYDRLLGQNMAGSPTYQPSHFEYMAQCAQSVSINWIQTFAGRLAVHSPVVAIMDIQVKAEPPAAPQFSQFQAPIQPNIQVQGYQMSPGPMRRAIQAPPPQMQMFQPAPLLAAPPPPAFSPFAPVQIPPQPQPSFWPQPQPMMMPPMMQPMMPPSPFLALPPPPQEEESIFSGFKLPGIN